MSYRENQPCPGCGRAHWLIGRATAECAFCSTALPLAEASRRAPPRVVQFGKGGGIVRRHMVPA
jgi:hypothetical protein